MQTSHNSIASDRVEAAYVVWLPCHQVQNMSVTDPQVDCDKMVVHSLCPVKSTEYVTINQTKDVMVFTWIILPLFGNPYKAQWRVFLGVPDLTWAK
jgi:hypothetical protein